MRMKAATALAGAILAVSGASAILAVSAASALARPAVTTTDSNLRGGPGVENPVVGVLPAGSAIDVGNCAGTWCRVSGDGLTGFLSRSLIAFGGARGAPAVATLPPGPGPVGSDVGPYPDDYAYTNNNGYYDSYGPDYAYGPGYGYDGYGYGPGVGIGFSGGYDGGRAQSGQRLRNLGGGNGQARAVAADPGSMTPNRVTPGAGVTHARGAGFRGAGLRHGGGRIGERR